MELIDTYSTHKLLDLIINMIDSNYYKYYDFDSIFFLIREVLQISLSFSKYQFDEN